MGKSSSFPSREIVDRIHTTYPVGCRVELEAMNDPYGELKSGSRGTVSFIDSTGTIFVDWDCGSMLGVVYGVDRVRKL